MNKSVSFYLSPLSAQKFIFFELSPWVFFGPRLSFIIYRSYTTS